METGAVKGDIKIGGRKNVQDPSESFAGMISCLQMYEGFLVPSQVDFLRKCRVSHTYETKFKYCPDGFEYFKNQCFKISKTAVDFATAELQCTSEPGT